MRKEKNNSKERRKKRKTTHKYTNIVSYHTHSAYPVCTVHSSSGSSGSSTAAQQASKGKERMADPIQ